MRRIVSASVLLGMAAALWVGSAVAGGSELADHQPVASAVVGVAVAAQTPPRYDGELCRNIPAQRVQGSWQTSLTVEDPNAGVQGFGPGFVMPGDVGLIMGLRSKFGESGDYFSVTLRIYGPSGYMEEVSGIEVIADEWAEAQYPLPLSDWPMADGLYTVVWETDEGGFIACAGFEVRNG